MTQLNLNLDKWIKADNDFMSANPGLAGIARNAWNVVQSYMDTEGLKLFDGDHRDIRGSYKDSTIPIGWIGKYYAPFDPQLQEYKDRAAVGFQLNFHAPTHENLESIVTAFKYIVRNFAQLKTHFACGGALPEPKIIINVPFEVKE